MATVRLVQEDELEPLLALYGHLHSDDDPRPEPTELEAAWRQLRDDPRTYLYVVEHDQRLVASCALSVIPNLTRGCRPYGLVENVVTHELYRRHGFGSLAVAHALSAAWDQRCYKVMLLTGRQSDGTHQFYQRCGFIPDKKTGYITYPPSPEMQRHDHAPQPTLERDQ